MQTTMTDVSPSTSFWENTVSLWCVTKRYRKKISVTWSLLLIEALLDLLFPLGIGFAIDALMDSQYDGLVALGVLSLAVMIAGAGRRFYDTRTYAAIYRDLANALVKYEHHRCTATTKVSARISLLYEVVDFLEDSLPTILGCAVAFVGIVVVVALLDARIMVGCLVASMLVFIIYTQSAERIFRYNQSLNDELERQVAVLQPYKERRINAHFYRQMRWNIKLSDLETLNFSLVWLVLASLLIVAIVFVADNTTISYGQKMTSIMYVIQYIEVVLSFPLFYQQIVRLQEIMGRLSGKTAPQEKTY
jgi:ABC-type multidrug transport system fused ATPase/permease subunit